MKQYTGYVGTYFSDKSLGIYRFHLDAENGTLSQPVLAFDVPDSKYVAMRNDGLLASIVSRQDGAGVHLIDLRSQATPFHAEALTESGTGCYIAFHQDCIYTANFHAGTVSCYRIVEKTLVFAQMISIAPAAGSHQIVFHHDYMLVPCMELDEIHLFRLSDLSPCGIIQFPKGSGPRHAIFDSKHENLYVAAQKDNTLYCFQAHEDGRFTLSQTVPLLEAADPRRDETAAIRLSPDEKFIYISVRGSNLIVVLQRDGDNVHVIQRISCGGDHPRDIELSPDGAWLLAANRSSGDLVSFPRDAVSGLLGEACGHIIIQEGVSIVFDVL